MDYTSIEQILQKYWAGETSLEEEKLLIQFFTSSEVPAHLEEHQSYFTALHQMQSVKLDDTFDEEILQIIQERGQKDTKTISISRSPKRWLSMAASFVAILTVGYFGWFHEPNEPKYAVVDSYETPEQAFAQLKNSLMGISGTLNEGKQHSLKLAKFDQSRKKIIQ